MPFAATRVGLEIVLLVKQVRKRETNITCYPLYLESKIMMQMNSFTKP